MAQQVCATCHAIAQSGDSPHPIAPTFRDLAARGNRFDALGPILAGALSTGHLGMPSLTFETQELADLRAYLLSLKKGAR